MSWWSAIHAVDVLFVAAADEPFGRFEGVYREAVRRIESGRYQGFDVAEKRMEIFMCSAERVLPRVPWGAWTPGGVPRDLAARFARSTAFPMTRIPVGNAGAGIVVPSWAVDSSGLVLPPAQASLEPEWNALFPGSAIAEAIPFREALKEAMARRATRPNEYRRVVQTRTRERVELLECPDRLPYWDLLAAEDEGDALAAAQERFGLPAVKSWPELRGLPAFQAATRVPMRVAVALGWQGVMWLQLAVTISPASCRFEGCLEPVAEGLVKYCGPEHQAAARRMHTRERVRNSRRNLRKRS